MGFNPLHCGAVVASSSALTYRTHLSVSIPFIAGQWSLRKEGHMEMIKLAGFNPLHCGAVVASAWACDAPNTAR